MKTSNGNCRKASREKFPFRPEDIYVVASAVKAAVAFCPSAPKEIGGYFALHCARREYLITASILGKSSQMDAVRDLARALQDGNLVARSGYMSQEVRMRHPAASVLVDGYVLTFAGVSFYASEAAMLLTAHNLGMIPNDALCAHLEKYPNPIASRLFEMLVEQIKKRKKSKKS
ncbi:MAG TPA: hypothetical protein VGE35_02430 [Candidatus Paceibacterota bacterium]